MTPRTTRPLVLLAMLMLATAAHAGADLGVAGFSDFLVALRGADASGENFALGQAEVDLSADWQSRTVVDVAVAYDAGAESFGLGALTATFQLTDEQSGLFGSQDWGASMALGKFDVPFGLDYNYYPSLERRFVSAPLAVSEVHGFWNDVGVQATVDGPYASATMFAVNGFGCQRRGVTRAGEDLSRSLGGRAGVRPASWLELGASGAVFLLTDGEGRTSNLVGADMQVNVGRWHARAEGMWQAVGETEDYTSHHWGAYAQAVYEVDRAFGGVRYDLDHPDGAYGVEATHLSAVAGWRWRDGVEMRLEHSSVLTGEGDDAAWLQVVMGF